MNNKILLELTNITQSFPRQNMPPKVILENINFKLYQKEIVALIGKSGSGKSTILRIISELIDPTSGSVKIHNVGKKHAVDSSMIFQTFALFPWLTVLENVEIGLEALGVDKVKRRKASLEAIDLIGLDGYELAYPRELSGGMKQRVGFARALVMNPKILLMDEPFSALDILTAENLKNDFLDLWFESKNNIEAVLLVTHNIEEALQLADRILVLSSNPGTIIENIPINLKHPRDNQSASFKQMVDQVYALMTSKSVGYSTIPGEEICVHEKLHDVSAIKLISFLEALSHRPYNGKADIPVLNQHFNLSPEKILDIIHTLSIMHFITVNNADITLTASGTIFASANVQEGKKIFAEHLIKNVPLVAYIHRILIDRNDKMAPRSRFIGRLEDHMSTEEANHTLDIATSWGRYAELFEYNDNTQTYILEIAHDKK